MCYIVFGCCLKIKNQVQSKFRKETTRSKLTLRLIMFRVGKITVFRQLVRGGKIHLEILTVEHFENVNWR